MIWSCWVEGKWGYLSVVTLNFGFGSLNAMLTFQLCPLLAAGLRPFTLGFCISEPQFTLLLNGDNNTCLMVLCGFSVFDLCTSYSFPGSILVSKCEWQHGCKLINILYWRKEVGWWGVVFNLSCSSHLLILLNALSFSNHGEC